MKQVHKQHRIRCRASYGSDSTDEVGERRSGGPDREGSGAALLKKRLERHEGALKPESVSTKQERIAQQARQNPVMAVTSLNHYLDAEWMEYAFECTCNDGAVGVDGVTGQAYAESLQSNLADLINRIKSGRCRALSVVTV